MIYQKFSLVQRASGFRFLPVLLAVSAMATERSVAASPAPQSYGLYNTGINPAGMIGLESLDPEYTVAIEAPAAPLSSSNLYVTDPTNLPFTPPDNGISAFISPQPTYANHQYDAGGEYDFSTTFNLTGVNLSTLTLVGRFESDDRIDDIVLNGHSLGISLADPDYKAFSQYFNLIPNAGFLNPGVNTLTFKLYNFANTDTDPVALRTEFLAAVPEPSIWAGIGSLVCLTIFGGWLRRRRTAV